MPPFTDVGKIGEGDIIARNDSVVVVDEHDSTGIYSADGRHQLGRIDPRIDPSIVALGNSDDSTIYTLRETHKPAQGLDPETTGTDLVAYSRLGAEKWRVTVDTSHSSTDDTAPTIALTSDGKWLAIYTPFDHGRVVSTVSRTVRNAPASERVIGKWLIDNGFDNNDQEYDKLLDPETGNTVRKFTSALPDAATPFTVERTTNVVLSDGSTVIGGTEKGIYELDLSSGKFTKLTNWPMTGASTDYFEFQKVELSPDESVMVYNAGGQATDAPGPVQAYSLRDRRLLWTQEKSNELCGLGQSRVAVLANSQLVILNGSTGKQTDYYPNLSACPDMSAQYIYRNNGVVLTSIG